MEKYAPLRDYLRQLAGHETEATLTFAQIEQILGDRLPPSAYHYSAWWANERRPHLSQRQSWKSAGWAVAKVHLRGRWVQFNRQGQ